MHDYIACKLDRAFCLQHCLDFWNFVSYLALPRFLSNNNPFLLQFCSRVVTSPKPLHFQSMWVKDDSFFKVVSLMWLQPFGRNDMLWLMLKLKCLKQALRIWNREVFGDVNFPMLSCGFTWLMRLFLFKVL